MKLSFKRKTNHVKVREVVLNDRALKKAAKESIKDQNKVHEKAVRLRARSATR